MPARRTKQSQFDEKGAPEKSLSDDAEMMYAAQRLSEAESDYDGIKEKVGELRTARKHIVGLVKTKGLPNGLYRVGEFLIEIADRNGGGFKVDAWQSKRVGLSSFVAPSSNGAD